jgi:hypothetical protein
MTLQEKFELAQLILTALGVIGAFYAYTLWRAETRGKDEYEIGKRLGFKAIELGNSLHAVRAGRSDKKIREKVFETLKKEGTPLGGAVITLTRARLQVDHVYELLDELERINWEAKLVGVDSSKTILDLKGFASSIWTAAEMVGIKEHISAVDLALFEKIASGNEDDEEGKKITTLTEEIQQNALRLMTWGKSKQKRKKVG